MNWVICTEILKVPIIYTISCTQNQISFISCSCIDFPKADEHYRKAIELTKSKKSLFVYHYLYFLMYHSQQLENGKFINLQYFANHLHEKDFKKPHAYNFARFCYMYSQNTTFTQYVILRSTTLKIICDGDCTIPILNYLKRS